MNTPNATIEQFIIEVSLINPVNDIIYKLEKREFRDCDIKWLNTKLENFTAFACKTLNEKVIVPSNMPSEGYVALNEYVINKYLEYFKILLNYFKSF